MPDSRLEPTPYREVNDALNALLAGARVALGDLFAGLYVHGSLAMGGFEPGRSDVDFVVATAAPLPVEVRAALEAMHARLAASGRPWVDRLEGSYIPLAALRRYDPGDAHHPALRVDGTFDVDHHGIDWVLQLYVLREHGLTVAGPPVRMLVEPIGQEELRRAALGILHEWWVPQLDDPARLQSAEYRAYAILTMCRILYTVEHGTVVPKADAARWAQAVHQRRWAGLIERGLAWRHGMALDGLDDVLAWIGYTVERVERGAGGSAYRGGAR